MMTQEEIERLADAVHMRMAKAVLSLPAEFKELVLPNYMLIPLQIPMKDRNDNYFRLDIRTNSSGYLIFRLSNMFGEILKEWVME